MDWDDQIILRKKAPSTKVASSDSFVNSARRNGAQVEVEKKFQGGANKNVRTDINTAKIDSETDVLSVPKVPPTVAKAIQQGRQAAGLNQKELAVKVNEKAQVINEYESGKAIPNQQVLGKLERALGIKLRGHNIGEPLPKKK